MNGLPNLNSFIGYWIILNFDDFFNFEFWGDFVAVVERGRGRVSSAVLAVFFFVSYHTALIEFFCVDVDLIQLIAVEISFPG